MRAEFPDLVLEKPTVAQAALYADWMSVDVAKGNGSIQGNSWLTSAAGSHPTIMSKPRSCFDAEFYIMVSPSDSTPVTTQPGNLQRAVFGCTFGLWELQGMSLQKGVWTALSGIVGRAACSPNSLLFMRRQQL